MYRRGDIWKVKLYPTRESEQDGVRPCLIVSPDSLNKNLNNVIVLPMTRSSKNWPTRVEIKFKKQLGQACIEHIRSVSKSRLVERLGRVSKQEYIAVTKHLLATFEM